jgi:uncharacterized protein YdiU (UPF0061 family)
MIFLIFLLIIFYKFPFSYSVDMMQKNHAAITTRVAPSFMRVGHLQLFERRVCSISTLTEVNFLTNRYVRIKTNRM